MCLLCLVCGVCSFLIHLVINVLCGCVRCLLLNFDCIQQADICRGAYLYWYGGYHLDVDLVVIQDFRPFIWKETSFISVVSALTKTEYFQAFMGATPLHPIVFRYLQLFLAEGGMHLGKRRVGTYHAKKAVDHVRHDGALKNHKVQLWQETKWKHLSSAVITRNKLEKRSFSGRYANTVVLDGSRSSGNVLFFSHTCPGWRFCGHKV